MNGTTGSLKKYIFCWRAGFIWHVIAPNFDDAVATIPSYYFNDGMPIVIKRAICPYDDVEPNTIYSRERLIRQVGVYNNVYLSW